MKLWPDCPPDDHDREMADLMKAGGTAFLAENSNSQTIGFVEISVRTDYVPGAEASPIPYIEGWYVEKNERRRGIGTALVRRVELWASECGFSQLASDAELGNSSGIEAHRYLGFREVGRGVFFVRELGNGDRH